VGANRQGADLDDEMDLHTLVTLLWRGRLWLAAFVLVCGSLAAAHAFLSQKVYRAEALLAVRTTEMSGAGGLLQGQLGRLTSLAGLNLGNSAGRRQEFVAFLRSRALAREFVTRREVLPELYPTLWDPATRKLRPDSKGRAPSLGDAVDYVRSILDIEEDARTGLITVACEWTDPAIAAKWVNEYVALANEKLRAEAIAEGHQSVKYLNEELTRTTLEPVRQSLFGIMEGRLNQVMLASVEHDYAFKPIDRAEAPGPGKFVSPKRAIEIVIGILVGAMLGVVFLFWRYARSEFGHAPGGRTP
jgi:uncharacterized protein involved in exopolysaccharide biosynthesis